MRTAARLALAIVVMLGSAVVLPRAGTSVLTDAALAQPLLATPTIPDLLGTPEPLPTSGGGGGGGGGSTPEPPSGGGSGGGGGTGSGGGSGSSGDSGSKAGSGAKNSDAADKAKKAADKKKKRKRGKKNEVELPILPDFEGTYVPGGNTFTTDVLVSAAARMRALGFDAEEINAKLYPPFIVAGKAAWNNTWGAPRFGPGPIVRTHEGQDVFCKYGDPVLAPADGRVSYSDGGLGGVTARVHVSSAEYWYLTHLSDTNEAVFPMGSRVETGDVIGFCGNSGNALTTPPHVHFGWYVGGKAKNPHRSLVQWLRTAETRTRQELARTTTKRVEQIDRLTLARRFGDGFAPQVSEMAVSGESLWAAGSSPASGAFGLAEAALQAALARAENAPALSAGARSEGADDHGSSPTTTRLAELLRATPIRANGIDDSHNHD